MNPMRGFTLVEVMVALLIIGLVYGAAIRSVGDFATQRTRLDAAWPAHFIAWNRLIESWLQSTGAARDAARQGEQGSVRVRGRDWTWQLEVRPAQGQGIDRYQASVHETGAAHGAPPAADLYAFFRRDGVR
jgi:general secretion pathway protein I